MDPALRELLERIQGTLNEVVTCLKGDTFGNIGVVTRVTLVEDRIEKIERRLLKYVSYGVGCIVGIQFLLHYIK